MLTWTVAQTPIRHIIFWETVIKTRSIYVNCFNTLRCPAEVSTKLQKMHFLDKLRTITQEESKETRQMTPFFIYFFCSYCNIYCYIWKWSRFIFLGPCFDLFWSVKYLNFEQKLSIRTAHLIFLENRHPEVTKNPYYVLSPKGSQKKVSAYGLIPVCRGVYIHYFKINPPTFCCPLFSENYLNP